MSPNKGVEVVQRLYFRDRVKKEQKQREREKLQRQRQKLSESEHYEFTPAINKKSAFYVGLLLS